jgi:hypothetical protein
MTLFGVGITLMFDDDVGGKVIKAIYIAYNTLTEIIESTKPTGAGKESQAIIKIIIQILSLIKRNLQDHIIDIHKYLRKLILNSFNFE